MKNYPLIFLALTLLVCACDGFKKNNQNNSPTQYEQSDKMTADKEPVEVLARLSRKEIDISDFLTLTIEVRAKEGVRIIEPYLPPEVYHPLSPVGAPRKSGFWSIEKKRHTTIWKYKFEPTEPGRFSLKPLELFFRPFYKVKTKEIHYLVKAPKTTPGDDIRGVKGMVFPAYNYLPLAIVASASGLVVLLLWLSLGRKKRKREKERPPKSKRDYYLEALRRLDDLERRNLIGKRKFEKLHVNLSGVLRDYIEGCFGIRAAEQTSEEFLQYISQSSSFSDELQATLREFLSLADLVKFAVFEPGFEANEKAMRKVRDFIVATGEETDEV